MRGLLLTTGPGSTQHWLYDEQDNVDNILFITGIFLKFLLAADTHHFVNWD
jgi:hypothetical protein